MVMRGKRDAGMVTRRHSWGEESGGEGRRGRAGVAGESEVRGRQYCPRAGLVRAGVLGMRNNKLSKCRTETLLFRL